MIDLVQDRQALARAVRRRRHALHLRRCDVEALGGPSEGTMRYIERAAPKTFAPRTLRDVETALDLAPGLLRRVLDGEVVADGDHEDFGRVVRVPRAGSGVTSVVSALASSVAELSSLPDASDEERAALVHVLEALSLLRSSVRP